MSDLLFVYGTLRQGHSNAMAVYLSQHAEYVTDGWFQGQLYQISFYPGAVASDDPHHRVTGEVYHLKDSQTVLPVLDNYEECSTQYTQPTEYVRVPVNIQTIDGATLKHVWMYIYQGNIDALKVIESGDFMKKT